MNEPWRITLLGGLSAAQGGRVVDRFRTRKTAGLLAYLALNGERRHPRDTLLDTLWPESDLTAARNSLSVALSSLRSQLDPPATTVGNSPTGMVIIADRSIVALRPGSYTTDVADFEARLLAAQEATGNDSRSIVLLQEAANSYTGELLPGFYDDWVLPERERLADAYLQALRQLTSLFMEAREFDRALDCIHKAIQTDPLSEESRRLLIRLYAIVGRPEAGLKQFRELERLREAAGESPPSNETRALALRLAEGTDKDSGRTAPPRRQRRGDGASKAESAPLPEDQRHGAAGSSRTSPPPRPVAGLPIAFTRFFGRQSELDQLGRHLALDATRLLTLTGPGGVGKTRLAIEAARRYALNRQDEANSEVWFVPLAELTEPTRIIESIRDAMQLPRGANSDPLDQIAERVGATPFLLVLDNLEHLLAGGPLDKHGAAAVVQNLLSRLPRAQVIVTSRSPLGLPGEHEFIVPPLPIPAGSAETAGDLRESPSVQLFVDRARSRRVDFQVTPRNAGALSELCARLEGIPLALELAAAQSKLLSPAELLRRLDQRFEVLVSRKSSIPERQRTLYGAIDWGYNLLTPEARRYFSRLSVFHGDWSVEAAEAICEADDPQLRGRTLDCLRQLRDASFVTLNSESRPGTVAESRLRLLETLRAFAEEKLEPAERSEILDRHTAHFLHLVESAEPHLRGPEQNQWFDRLETEHDNLRAVLARTLTEETGLKLSAGLALFWKMRGHYREGADWLDRALAVSDGASPLARAKAFGGVGMLAFDRGEYQKADMCFAQNLSYWESVGNESNAAITAVNLGNVAYRRGDLPLARARYEGALNIHRRLGNDWGVASALGSLGNVAQTSGDYAAARVLQEESLALSRQIGDTRMTAYTLHNLANLAAEQGEYERARPLYEESLAGKRSLGDQRGVNSLLLSLAFLEMETEGDFGKAFELLSEALTFSWKLGDRLTTVATLDALAWHATSAAQYERATLLWAAASAGRDLISAPYTPLEQESYYRRIETARAAMATSEAFDVLWARGQALSLEAAVRFAQSPVD